MPNTDARARRPAEQTRALLLEAAVERVKAEGLRLDYANIELEDLIRSAGVPRSTVFRIWPDRPAFVADLVRALFEADPGYGTGFDAETLGMIEQTIAAAAAAGGADGRRAALRSVVRLTVAHNVVAVEDSVAWRAYRTMSAALAGGDAVPGGEAARTLLSELETRYLDRMAEVYRQLNAALGLRMRDGVTERDLGVAIMAMIEGMSDHRRIDPDGIDRPRTVAIGQEGAHDWHVASLAVYGIYCAFTDECDA